MVKVGDYVRITKNGVNHCFSVGDIVKVEKKIGFTELIVAYNDRIKDGELHACVLAPDNFELYFENDEEE